LHQSYTNLSTPTPYLIQDLKIPLGGKVGEEKKKKKKGAEMKKAAAFRLQVNEKGGKKRKVNSL